MEWVEVTARTVEDAKDRALDHLGVDESLAEFEVLEEPRTGLFGRLKGEARVRARIRPMQPRPKVERRDKRRRRGRDERPAAGRAGSSESGDRTRSSRPPAGAPPSGSRSPATTPAVADDPSGPPVVEGVSLAPVGRSEAAEGGEAGAGEAGEGAEARGSTGSGSRGSGSRNRGPRGPRTGRTGPRNAGEDDTPMSDHDGNGRALGEVDEAAVAREVQAAEVFLSGLLEAFGLEGTVQTTVQDDDARELRVSGQDLGLLIGPRGGTIEAVQELTRLAARRDAGGRGEARIRVDVGGYRERRREALARFARSVATEVRESGTPKALEPMSSPDRKIVHDAVAEVDGVASLSEGEEPRRRVVLVPRS